VSSLKAVYERCAGLDIHKKTVVACRIVPNGQGGWQTAMRTFGTMTPDLLALSDWLHEGNISHVAMESTGIYWRPIFNILESSFQLLLVNAQHIKFVPGRKTDVKDAQWIAELLQHGLLKASYIPAAPQRTMRELLKYRQYLTQERTRESNRVQKVLEDAKSDVSWGNQIRSYVLDQSRIKDLRTGVEVGNSTAVLDRDLDQFLEASLKAGV